MKRLLFIPILLLYSLFSFAFEVDGIAYNITSEASLTVEVTSKSYSCEVAIPESVTYEGKDYAVASIGDFAFSWCSGLTSVTISEGVTRIGDYAFNGCSGLTSLTIPSSVTSIGYGAFDGTPWFDNQPDGLVYINNVAYRYKGKIPENTSIEIKEGTLTISDRAFQDCSGLTSVTIPSSVTSIGGWAFENCSGLTSLTISEGVKSIGVGAFQDCSGLTSLTIPESVTSIGGWAFINCSNLTSVVIPEGVISIGEMAFQSCKSLTSVTIPSSVTSMGVDVFVLCSGLTSISIESGNTVYDSRENCNAIIRTADNTLITGCMNTVIPSSVTSIGRCAFYECSGLTSLTIPSNVTEIGDRAFYNNSGLTSIVVEDGNTVYDSRNNCNAIIKTSDNTLIQGCMNTVIPSNVTSIDREAFYGCSGLTSLTIPSSVTLIGFMAFHGCSGLTSIIVEDGNTVYDSRNNCNAIIKTSDNTLIRGCTSTVIPSNVVSLDHYAFTGCSALTSIMIPSSVTSIGSHVFADCNGLTSIVVEEGNTVYDSRDNCNAIIRTSNNTLITGCKNTVIPTGVTSIGNGAFYGCSGLTSLTIPSSVTSIGGSAFFNSSGLTSVIVGWEIPLDIGGSVFDSSNYNNATLFVPKGTKAAYEAANVWKDFGKIVEYDLPQENIEATEVAAVDNVIYMEPFEATKGKEVTVPLRMKNTAGIRGFQFDMQLPLGVTVAKDGNNRPVAALNSRRLPEGSAHTLTVSEQADGSVRFLCASQYDETFTGSDGEILTVRLCLDPHMLDGQYPVVLKDVTLSETNISNFYKTETVQTALTVISYTPGDISGDGEIDVSDYIGVANYIHGNTPAGFVAAAADVNKDNTVDVLDYIGIANLILYNSVYGNTNVNASRRTQRQAVTDVATLDNVVYLEPFEAKPGGEVQLKLKMKNTAQIRGFQFDLYLPEGITAKKYGNGRIVCTLNDGRRPAGDQHTLTLSERPDGAIRFLCGSQYDETFTGNDGEIATLTISVAADVEADNYPIYLRNMKLTETDINNYYTTDEIETSVTVTGPADGRIVLDEASTTAPEAANGVDVRVKRTINANEWSTICLPFAMSATQVKAAFGNDVQLADFTSYDTVEDTGENVVGLTVNFNMVTAIEANHPYVIKVSNAISEFTADNVTIDPEEEPCVEYDNGLTGKKRVVWGIFTGTYVADCVIPYEGDDVSLFLSGNKWWYATAQTKHMKGYRAYFWFTDLLPDVSASRIQMAFNDETTNVVELKDGRMEELKSCYNLKGQRVEKPLKKGLYIRNAKKVIIK